MREVTLSDPRLTWMPMHATHRVLDETEAPLDTFHDCHVYGVSWDRDGFRFRVDIGYITEWISPEQEGGSFRFLIARATLVFESASDVTVTMDWTRCALDAQIDAIEICGERRTANGSLDRKYEILFSEPDAHLSVWSLCYKVHLHHEPVLSTMTALP